jgi:N-formylmaleamate deformylase
MSDWTSGDVVANDVRLHYYRTGGTGPASMAAAPPRADGVREPRDLPPIVALHGITDSGRTWSRVAEGLAADYDVIMLDARGHGLSEATESGYTAEDQAPDVAGVIRALGLGRVVLLGHSMGGATAVATAAVSPDLVRALILEDPPWGGPPDSATAAEREARSAEWQRSILKRKAQAISEIVTFGRRRLPDWDERDVAMWAEAKQQTSPNIANGINGRGIRWQDVVRQVRCPVWVIYGDRAAGSGSQARSSAVGTAGSRVTAGAILSREIVEEAQSLCPGVKAVHVPGAGHEIRRGHYPQFMAALRACLHDIEKSDS